MRHAHVCPGCVGNQDLTLKASSLILSVRLTFQLERMLSHTLRPQPVNVSRGMIPILDEDDPGAIYPWVLVRKKFPRIYK